MSVETETLTETLHQTTDTVGEVESVKPKAKAKKIKEEDMLVAMVQEISNLDGDAAIALVPTLLDGADANYIHLGGVLSEIQSKKYFEPLGYENFRQFVEQYYGIQYRKAMYWIQIYDKLIESGVSWNKVKAVGWTKLKDLATILTVENVDEWVQKALSMTVLQLQEAIKKFLSGTLPNSGITPDSEESGVTTVTFKVHEDQKITIKEAVAKARLEAQTEYDGVAIEAICMNYLAGGNVTKPQSLVKVMAMYSPEEVLTALEEAFPDLEVVAKLKK